MHKQVLIVGQGISGTFLSWYLEQAGISFIMIDAPRPHTASRSAAGIVNPVTGRRIVTTWMIEELLPFAEQAYEDIATGLQKSFMEKHELVDFFPSAQMRLAFLDRLASDPSYLRLPADEHDRDESFHYQLGYGLIAPCLLIDMPGLISAARQRLQEKQTLIEENFDLARLRIEGTHVHYRDITADRIIFCDGIAGADNPLFSRLPFAPNKGEALLLEIPELPRGIYKKGLTLAPWGQSPSLFWVGSSYEWSFTDDQPSEAFLQRTTTTLREWLKIPFTIVEHFASVRPATLERRPFVGFHPAFPQIGILNGMGTKGCSLAPYFSRQMTEHILTGSPIRPDADIKRFTKLLGQNSRFDGNGIAG
jgi:glycine/D-amino acid oxidase-like deaminating enzyme